MLIVIDNFEDIEEPSEHLADTSEGRKLLSDVNREYKYFQDFFTRWSVEYQGLESNPENPLKSITQIIITTRGKGESQQNHPMQRLGATKKSFDIHRTAWAATAPVSGSEQITPGLNSQRGQENSALTLI